MRTRFRDSGNPRTLLAAFLYFDLSFAAWVLLGPLGVQVAASIGIGPGLKGVMVAVPVLSGALLRILAGTLVDRVGPRRTGIALQIVVIAALLVAAVHGIGSFGEAVALGLMLGVAGASFAVALPLVSRWYPPEHQGIALGIAGAGNSGTVLTALLAPSLAALIGVDRVFAVAAAVLLVVLGVFVALAREAPAPRIGAPARGGNTLRLLARGETWACMGFYAVTFGGFAGLASYLTIYFNTEFGLRPAVAGDCTAAAVFAGSLVRPLGGLLADRVGGRPTLAVVYAVAAAAFLGVASAHVVTLAVPLLAIGMLSLGIGNGAVFGLVPLVFGREAIGGATGLVGMAGGVGGFALASGLGWSRAATGGYALGFGLYAAVALLALAGALGAGALVRTRLAEA